MFEAHKREKQTKGKRGKGKENSGQAANQNLAKRQKREDSSGARGSFYNKYKYWRTQLKLSGQWMPKNIAELNDETPTLEESQCNFCINTR